MTVWCGNVGEQNARWLATECRTAWLASEYRPRDRGGGYVEVSALALGALRELGEEEDGYITDDGDGLRIWIGDAAFELEPAVLRAQPAPPAGEGASSPAAGATPGLPTGDRRPAEP